MDNKPPSTCVTKGLKMTRGVNNHEVHIEKAGCPLTQGSHNVSSKGDGRNEDTIHYINVQTIRTCVNNA
jgi:hypothetical protein